ncbi:MAG: DUF131 domain-containing protein [Candidatus Aenigmatarchaeota archaeon]
MMEVENLVIFLVGIMLIFIGIFILLFLFLKEKQIKTQGGFAIWIGPFPIIGSSSKEMFYAILFVSLAIFVLLFLIKKIL